jgi:hypothetical protein
VDAPKRCDHSALENGGVSKDFGNGLPDLHEQREVYEQVVRDFQREGLSRQCKFLNLMMTVTGILESRTTARGKRLISFVTAPE